jgi:hypothetical protein
MRNWEKSSRGRSCAQRKRKGKKCGMRNAEFGVRSEGEMGNVEFGLRNEGRERNVECGNSLPLCATERPA